jgi:hypothetical protein
VTFGGGACRQGSETVSGVALYEAATQRLWSALDFCTNFKESLQR